MLRLFLCALTNISDYFFYARLVYLGYVPYDVDIKRLSVQSALQRNTILEYLNYLEKADILHLLYSDYYNAKKMQKPDKILMDNSNR